MVDIWEIGIWALIRCFEDSNNVEILDIGEYGREQYSMPIPTSGYDMVSNPGEKVDETIAGEWERIYGKSHGMVTKPKEDK